MGPERIAKQLQSEKVLVPTAYAISKGRSTCGKLPKDKCYWSPAAVSKILARMEYIGHTVNFRTTRKSYKHKAKIELSPENWHIFKNTHAPIIDEDTFDQAQIINGQRSEKNEEKTQMARNTKGKTLLSGNIYCAHCGSHMIATSYVDSHLRADGSKYEVRKQRYICCNKSRHRGVCDGQSGYVSDRIDGAVDIIVREYLSHIKTTAKSVALERRYQNEIAEMKLQQREVEQENRRLKDRLAQLSTEIEMQGSMNLNTLLRRTLIPTISAGLYQCWLNFQ